MPHAATIDLAGNGLEPVAPQDAAELARLGGAVHTHVGADRLDVPEISLAREIARELAQGVAQGTLGAARPCQCRAAALHGGHVRVPQVQRQDATARRHAGAVRQRDGAFEPQALNAKQALRVVRELVDTVSSAQPPIQREHGGRYPGACPTGAAHT